MSILWDVPKEYAVGWRVTFIHTIKIKAAGPPDTDAICLSGVLPRDHGPHGGLQVDVLAPSAGGKCWSSCAHCTGTSVPTGQGLSLGPQPSLAALPQTALVSYTPRLPLLSEGHENNRTPSSNWTVFLVLPL